MVVRMKKNKKFFMYGVMLGMIISIMGCSASNLSEKSVETTESKDEMEENTEDIVRKINIGSWWKQYYDSSHESVSDNPAYRENIVEQMKFDKVAVIEEKYNCEFYWKNLTYEGVKESINQSIPGGKPDCDIYLVDLSFGIPAALNGLAVDLKTVLPKEDDLFTTQKNVKFLDLGDGKACILKRVEAASTVEATYPLAFNKQMLEENNLEDPRVLYREGKWTWDTFIEYCKVLTKDVDGDGQLDQYGYCGFIYDTFEQLLLSNGASVAAGKTEELSSEETREVLQMITDMYNQYQICYPYDFKSGQDATTMREKYRDGDIGFFPIAAWIAGNHADYDFNGAMGSTLDFDTVYVQWPVGPSGDVSTNAGKVSAGEYYIIPTGVEDPEMVYRVLYDMWDWYEGDVSIRDDEVSLFWWYAVTAKSVQLQKENFNTMYEIGSRETFELWNSLGIGYDWSGLLQGKVTPIAFQEKYKDQIQAALDEYMKY